MDLLTAAELMILRRVPEADVIELAIELDLPVAPGSSVERIVTDAVVRLAQRARREGLPISRYDEPDLRRLTPDEIEALARLCGARLVPAPIEALLSQGERVYATYDQRQPRSQVLLLFPMLLAPLARHALATEGRAQTWRPRTK